MCRDIQPCPEAVCHPLIMSGSSTHSTFSTQDQPATLQLFFPLKLKWSEFNHIILLNFHPEMSDQGTISHYNIPNCSWSLSEPWSPSRTRIKKKKKVKKVPKSTKHGQRCAPAGHPQAAPEQPQDPSCIAFPITPKPPQSHTIPWVMHNFLSFPRDQSAPPSADPACALGLL